MRISSRKLGGPDGPLATMQPFDTYGALRAIAGTTWISSTGYANTLGWLPTEWRRKYESDALSPGIIYTVLSYATPIAWVRTDGSVEIPDVSYSVTTARHQSMVRAWLNGGAS